MLWVNLLDGALADSPKRPSKDWAVVVRVPYEGRKYHSTINGLRDLIMELGVPLSDIDLQTDGLDVFSKESEVKDVLKSLKFPYFKVNVASDGALEIRLDPKSDDNTAYEPVKTKGLRPDDEDTFKPQNRGGGGGGEPVPSEGQPSDGGEPADGEGEPSEGDGESGEGESGEDGQGEGSEDGEGGDGSEDGESGDGSEDGEGEQKDAYEEGKKSADDVSDDLKEKMKGTPAEESGEGGKPADGEGGAPAEGGEGGQGEGSEGGEGEGSEGGQGEGDEGESGEGSEDGESGDGSESGEGEGDGGDDEGGESGEGSEEGDDGEQDGEMEPSEDGKPMLSEEGQEAIEELLKESEDAKNAAEEAMKEGDALEARDQADKAEDCLNEAKDICENEGVNPDEVPEIEEIEDNAEEAEEFAQTAEEFLEKALELFEETGLEDEEFEDFLKGLLDEIFNEDEEEAMRQKILEELEMAKASRGSIRCVNWRTGEIRYFSPEETLTNDWVKVEKFFTGVYRGADEITTENTIQGAVDLAKSLGVKTNSHDKTSATFSDTTSQFNDLLKQMRMFQVDVNADGTTSIVY